MILNDFTILYFHYKIYKGMRIDLFIGGIILSPGSASGHVCVQTMKYNQ
ncbi:MAG: hypothetical protein ACFFE4_08625 [Candidatus Thorarchaeota archaeon]